MQTRFILDMQLRGHCFFRFKALLCFSVRLGTWCFGFSRSLPRQLSNSALPLPPAPPPPPSQMEDLRRDVELASDSHVRAVELRDRAINAALTGLADTDLQHEAALRSHVRGLDEMLMAHAARDAALESDFTREVAVLEKELAGERAVLVARHAQARAEITHTVHTLSDDDGSKATSEVSEFEQAREALRQRAIKRLGELQAEMDGRIENAESAFEEAHRGYLQSTSARASDLKALTERAAADALASERQQRALRRLSRLLTVWRSKNINNARDAAGRNEDLLGEVTAMNKHVELLKGKMTTARGAHAARLKGLSGAAAAVKGRLATVTVMAERLLVNAEAARQHESLSEKIDPFVCTRTVAPGVALLGAPSGDAVLHARAEVAALEEALEEGGGGGAAASLSLTLLGLPNEAAAAPGAVMAAAEAAVLEPFYGRLNRALLESLALERRRDRLKAENDDLQDALQQVLDGMRVTPSAVDGPNSLVILNGRATIDMGAGTAANPDLRVLHDALAATGPPPRKEHRVRMGGAHTGAPLNVRPGAPGVATVVVEAARVARTAASTASAIGVRRG